MALIFIVLKRESNREKRHFIVGTTDLKRDRELTLGFLVVYYISLFPIDSVHFLIL